MAIITLKANNSQMALIDVLSLMTLMAELKRPLWRKKRCKGPYGYNDWDDHNGCKDHNNAATAIVLIVVIVTISQSAPIVCNFSVDCSHNKSCEKCNWTKSYSDCIGFITLMFVITSLTILTQRKGMASWQALCDWVTEWITFTLEFSWDSIASNISLTFTFMPHSQIASETE